MNKWIIKTVLWLFLCSAFQGWGQTKTWTLRECVDYALKNNISIKQSELDLQNGRVAKKDAIGNFLPTLNASASHSWNIGLNQNITTGLLENQTIQFTSAGLNSSVAIYNGLQNMNQLKRARLTILAAQYQLNKMQDDVALNVANSYLQILFNKENLKVQQEQLANDEKQLLRASEMVKSGMIPRGDLLDAEATVAADRQRVIAAQNTLFLSKLSLAQLLQLDDFRNFDIAEANYEPSLSPTLSESPETIVKKALGERVELKIARTNLEAAERDLKISKGALQPSINGFYSFSTRASNQRRISSFIVDPNNPTNTIGFVPSTGEAVVAPNFIPIQGNPLPYFDQFSQFKGNSFGVQMTIPILNGFRSSNAVTRARIALERARTNEKQTSLDLERTVYTAITDAKGALQAYESAQTALNARKLAFDYAKERFNVGLSNSFELSQAQTLYTNAQSDLVRTKYDYIFKVKVVEFYFGIPIVEKL